MLTNTWRQLKGIIVISYRCQLSICLKYATSMNLRDQQGSILCKCYVLKEHIHELAAHDTAVKFLIEAVKGKVRSKTWRKE